MKNFTFASPIESLTQRIDLSIMRHVIRRRKKNIYLARTRAEEKNINFSINCPIMSPNAHKRRKN